MLGPDYQPRLELTTHLENDLLEISIQDNGMGIPEKNQEQVYTPFLTTKPTGKGIGLGLSIAYHVLVEGHNGEISLESEEGEFTRFTIKLPVNAAEAQSS